MYHNEKFRKVIKDKFKLNLNKDYFLDQDYINHLITSLNRVESNCYNQSDVGFISEFKYLESKGILSSITGFVDGCLSQLLWINNILESGKLVSSKKQLEKDFDYEAPIMLRNPWTLNKVTKKGVFFSGDDPYLGVRVIINSDNIIEIALALSKVVEKNEQIESIILPSSQEMELTLFKSKDLETKCLNVLKDINPPVLDVNGNFINKHGMKGAIVIWHYHCEVNGYINKNIFSSRNTLAKAVMDLIPHLSIDGSSFGRLPIAKIYKDEIEQKLKHI